MRIALLGYGKMGKMVEAIAVREGWDVGPRLDVEANPGGRGITVDSMKGVDVAVEFSQPAAVMANIEAAARAGVNLVGGTPGWTAGRERAERLGRALATFWRPERQRYSWARLSGGTHAEEIGKPYPEGLAQLYGLAFIEPRAMCWEAVCRDFTPETGPTVSFGAVWWLMAATRMGDEPKCLWRTRAAEAAAAFERQDIARLLDHADRGVVAPLAGA